MAKLSQFAVVLALLIGPAYAAEKIAPSSTKC